eukprot:9798491-Heterocapsa_arctica.AAC.1
MLVRRRVAGPLLDPDGSLSVEPARAALARCPGFGVSSWSEELSSLASRRVPGAGLDLPLA